MMVSFSATWLSVKCGSPSTRFDQTKTIAVQGAAASRIRPAIYRRFARRQQRAEQMADEEPAEQRHRERFDQPVDADRRRRCRASVAHLAPAPPGSIFSSIGTIISQTSTATGKLTCATVALPSGWKTPGITCPSAIPAMMQSATHSVRKRSKAPIDGALPGDDERSLRSWCGPRDRLPSASTTGSPSSLAKAPRCGRGQNIQHNLGRTAQLHAARRDDDRAIDQDRMRHHRVDQLIIRQCRIIQAERIVGRALPAQQPRTGMSMPRSGRPVPSRPAASSDIQ